MSRLVEEIDISEDEEAFLTEDKRREEAEQADRSYFDDELEDEDEVFLDDDMDDDSDDFVGPIDFSFEQ